MEIPQEAATALQDLERRYFQKIQKERAELERRFTKELIKELRAIARKYKLGIGFCTDEYEIEGFVYNFDSEEAMLAEIPKRLKRLAEMFVNNSITQGSIWDDPSADWDGHNRADHMEKRCVGLEELKEIFRRVQAEKQDDHLSV